MLCSQLYCQKVLRLKVFSYEIRGHGFVFQNVSENHYFHHDFVLLHVSSGKQPFCFHDHATFVYDRLTTSFTKKAKGLVQALNFEDTHLRNLEGESLLLLVRLNCVSSFVAGFERKIRLPDNPPTSVLLTQ